MTMIRAKDILVLYLGAVSTACAQEVVEEHPILQDMSAIDFPSELAQVPEHLSAMAIAISSAPEAWRVGAVSGDMATLFGHIVDVEVARNGDIYVLDALMNDIKVFSSLGQFQRLFGRAGFGPAEFRHPVAMDLDDDLQIVLASAGHVKTLAENEGELELRHVFNVGTNFPPVADLCLMQKQLFVRPAPSSHEGLVYRGAREDSASFVSFGTGYKHGTLLTRTELSAGRIACAPDHRYVVAAFTYLPFVEAFKPDGQRLWRARLRDFQPAKFEEIRDARGTRLRAHRGARSHMILRVIPTPGHGVLVQSAELSPAKQNSAGITVRKILARNTYLLDAATGHGMHVGNALPEILAVSDSMYFTSEEHPVGNHIQLVAYAYRR